MADRMTSEQVATLELPEGYTLELSTNGVNYVWIRPDESKPQTSSDCVAAVAAYVASGVFPRSVYDWAMRSYKGLDVPTVEQWEAAARLAALTRNDAHLDSIVTKLANVISPPKLPEIAACPYCGASGDLVGGAVQCRARCNYVGPARDNARDSIQAHNEVARKLRPAKETRACGGCKHFDPYPGLLCRTAHYTGGQARVLVRPAVPTRDASECERWEEKP